MRKVIAIIALIFYALMFFFIFKWYSYKLAIILTFALWGNNLEKLLDKQKGCVPKMKNPPKPPKRPEFPQDRN